MTDQSPLARPETTLSARLPAPDVLGPLLRMAAADSGRPMPVAFDDLRSSTWLTRAGLEEALSAAGLLTCTRSGATTWIQLSPFARVVLARARS